MIIYSLDNDQLSFMGMIGTPTQASAAALSQPADDRCVVPTGRAVVRFICKAMLAIGLATTATPSLATEVLFSGARGNTDAPGVAAERCGSRTTTSVRHDPPTATSFGTSNFGSFTPTLSHCIQLPPSTSAPTPFDLGEFLFTFETGDTLFGTYSGSLHFLQPGLFSVFQTHLVTGGTGWFSGATGSFDSSGTLSFLTGRPVVEQTFSGLLNIPPVPEPGTWLTMLLGFGLVGGMMRRRRPTPVNGLLQSA